MKLRYAKILPGGNGTALIGSEVAQSTRHRIATAILKKDKTIEQVGFVVPPRGKKAVVRLEMAGGEFCGNALRALGSIIEADQKKKKVYIETTVSPTPVLVSISGDTSSVTLPLSFFSHKKNICHLPGISHTYTLDTIDKKIAKDILFDTGLLSKKAAGVLSYEKKNKNSFSLSPFVWVKDIETLYEETACASGTLALAYMLYKKEGLRVIHVHQPSGAIFTVKLAKNTIALSGPKGKILKKSIDI